MHTAVVLHVRANGTSFFGGACPYHSSGKTHTCAVSPFCAEGSCTWSSAWLADKRTHLTRTLEMMWECYNERIDTEPTKHECTFVSISVINTTLLYAKIDARSFPHKFEELGEGWERGREGGSERMRDAGGKEDTFLESVILFLFPSSLNNDVSIIPANLNTLPRLVCIRKLWLNGRRAASVQVDADLAALHIGLSI